LLDDKKTPTGEQVQSEEERLVSKLRKIEVLFARPATQGEKVAAESALERIRERLRLIEKAEPALEYRFTLHDSWSKSLFIALLRRYGISPFRYRGQRHTTVMAKVTRTFVNETLWPEFQELNSTLRAHLQSVTERVVHQAIHRDATDVEERPGQRSEPGGRSPYESLDFQ
jgi:hypothetical protein